MITQQQQQQLRQRRTAANKVMRNISCMYALQCLYECVCLSVCLHENAATASRNMLHVFWPRWSALAAFKAYNVPRNVSTFMAAAYTANCPNRCPRSGTQAGAIQSRINYWPQCHSLSMAGRENCVKSACIGIHCLQRVCCQHQTVEHEYI